MPAGWNPTGLSFASLQLLRILDISYARFEGWKLPNSIGKLIHLKYLSLYKAWLSHLPSSLQDLKSLLYLNLDVILNSPVFVPNVLNEMQDLRYLSLPEEMHIMTKLEMGDLVNLEMLQNFQTKNCNVEDIQLMIRLRRLSIFFSQGQGQGCVSETLSSALGKLRHLETLTVYDCIEKATQIDPMGRTFLFCTRKYGGMGDAAEFVSNNVNLHELKLDIYMPSLPGGQNYPSRLTTIDLHYCELKMDPMPFLEKLLHLNEVSLRRISFRGKRMVCSGGGFPQLRELRLFRLDEWEEWTVKEGSMPLLNTLIIDYCEKLKELPEGLRFMTSLEELSIGTIKKEFKGKLEKGGEDYFKVQHIPRVNLSLNAIFMR